MPSGYQFHSLDSIGQNLELDGWLSACFAPQKAVLRGGRGSWSTWAVRRASKQGRRVGIQKLIQMGYFDRLGASGRQATAGKGMRS